MPLHKVKASRPPDTYRLVRTGKGAKGRKGKMKFSAGNKMTLRFVTRRELTKHRRAQCTLKVPERPSRGSVVHRVLPCLEFFPHHARDVRLLLRQVVLLANIFLEVEQTVAF